MPAGRPTKYTDSTISQVEQYLNTYESLGDATPHAAGLACELGVSKATLYRWAEKDPKFRDTLERVNTAQERQLLNSGLRSEFNPTITKLALYNHGYQERQEHSGPGGGPIEFVVKRRS